MPDCFLSYASQDQQLASRIYSELSAEDLDVFMAAVSIQGGEKWLEGLMRNVRASSCLLLLATKAAKASNWVGWELGGAVIANKRVIPVLWEIPKSELPAFAAHVQALTLGGTSTLEIRSLTSKIAKVVREEQAKGPPEAVALVKQSIRLIEARAYDSAIELLAQAVRVAPLAGDINYYLALASLKGKRPALLYLSEAETVSRYLERACTSDRPQAHYFYLWAVLKFDFYQAKGIRVRPPGIDELLTMAETYPFDQGAFEQMVLHAEAFGSLSNLGLL